MSGAIRRRRHVVWPSGARAPEAYPQLAVGGVRRQRSAARALVAGGVPLQRLEDNRALPALLTLARDPTYTRAFAVMGARGAEGIARR